MSTNILLIFTIFAVLLQSYHSYSLHISKIKHNLQSKSTTIYQSKDSSAWPKNRPPLPRPDYLAQKMDAAWGRGKFRSEVWDDDVNPLNDWWEAYAPSQEEIDAAQNGYDFANPQAWFESNGIDFDKATAEYQSKCEELYNQYKDNLNFAVSKLSDSEVNEAFSHYNEVEAKTFEIAYRILDNKKQELKGQPSLEVEDTGEQYQLGKEE